MWDPNEHQFSNISADVDFWHIKVKKNTIFADHKRDERISIMNLHIQIQKPG